MAATSVSPTDSSGANPLPTVFSNRDFSATSPNAASTIAGTPITGLGPFKSATFWLDVQGATGGTLDIYLQFTTDSGGTWLEFAHLLQLAAGAALLTKLFTISKLATIASPVLSTVGKGTGTMQLAAGTILNVDWGDQIRVLFVAGAGTTLGATETIKAVFTPAW